MFLPKFGKRLSERSRAPVHLEKAPRVEEGPAALVARATAPLRTLRLAAERPAVGVCTLAFLRRPALATAPRLLEGQLRSDEPHVDQLVLATLHRAIARGVELLRVHDAADLHTEPRRPLGADLLSVTRRALAQRCMKETCQSEQRQTRSDSRESERAVPEAHGA